jgi:hypothetical protein
LFFSSIPPPLFVPSPFFSSILLSSLIFCFLLYSLFPFSFLLSYSPQFSYLLFSSLLFSLFPLFFSVVIFTLIFSLFTPPPFFLLFLSSPLLSSVVLSSVFFSPFYPLPFLLFCSSLLFTHFPFFFSVFRTTSPPLTPPPPTPPLSRFAYSLYLNIMFPYHAAPSPSFPLSRVLRCTVDSVRDLGIGCLRRLAKYCNDTSSLIHYITGVRSSATRDRCSIYRTSCIYIIPVQVCPRRCSTGQSAGPNLMHACSWS